MREILFRAFVKDKNKIFNVKEIDFTNSYIHFEEENKPTDTLRMFDQIELMQYTGLTDKNDKPIYEGDIITCVNKSKHSGYPIGKKMYGFIAYNNDYCYWFCKNNFQHYIEWSWADDIEVIGNIYNNPELLGGAE